MNNTRNILACILGNVIEWYEFALFAYLAPVIAELFFPQQHHIAALLSTFSVFALGFLIRPLGAIVLGHLGDRIGRATTLKLTILMLSLSSVATGLLPTFHDIGILSTLLLVVCRLVQGFCVGGEFAGAMIYLTESAPSKHRALLSSMTNNGSNIGVLLAISACTITSNHSTHEFMLNFGWRILFILGGVMGMIGLYLRRDISESDTFLKIQAAIYQRYVPIKHVLKNERRNLTKIVLLLFISATGSYTIMNYISTYLHTFLNVPLNRAYQLQTIYIVITLALVPVFAYLSDIFGRRRLLLLTIAGYLIFTLPTFKMLQQHQSWWVLIPLLLCYSAEQAVIPATIVEMFPSKGRYTGISLAYNISMALVGGTSPLLNTFLINHFHNNLIIAYHVIICSIISGAIVVFSLSKQFGTTQCLVTNN